MVDSAAAASSAAPAAHRALSPAQKARKEAIRRWLDTDADLRPGFIELNDDLKALAAYVHRWERLAVGFRERV